METSNMTAAGPSRGLIDLLFGDEKEVQEPEEQFDPVLALVKALEKSKEGLSKTDGKTVPLLGAAVAQQQPLVIGAEAKDKDSTAALTGAEAILAQQLAQSGANQKGLDKTNGLNKEFAKEQMMSVENTKTQNILEKIRQNPAELASLTPAERTAAMKMIKERLAHMKQENPFLARLEKVIARDGLEKVLSVGSVTEIVRKLEQGELRSGISTEEFLMLGPNAKNSAQLKEMRDARSMEKAGLPIQDTNSTTGFELLSSEENFDSDGQLDSGMRGTFQMQPGDVDGTESFGQSLGLTLGPKSGAIAAPVIALSDLNTSSVRTAFMPEVVRNVEFIAQQGGGEMKISLRPKDLGAVELQVKTHANQVQVQMLVENQDLAEAIRHNTKELMDSLKEHKILVSSVDVAVKSTNTRTDMNFADGSNRESFLNENSAWQDQSQQNSGGNFQDSREFARQFDGEIDIWGNPSKRTSSNIASSDSARKEESRDPNKLVDLKA